MFSMGLDTYKVSIDDIFVANRCRLLKKLGPSSDVVVMVGGTNPERFDSDHEPLFRQESYFWWLTGVKEPDFSLMVDCSTGETTLYVPRLPASYATIMGKIPSLEEWKQLYRTEHVRYVDEASKNILEVLQARNTNGCSPQILLLHGQNTDSGNYYDYEPPFLKEDDKLQTFVNRSILFPVLQECRVHKSDPERALMRHVTEVTSHAHAYVMRNFQPGMMEYQAESLFRHYCYFYYGARYVGYTPICGCGPNAAILHYGHAGEPNSRQCLDGDMCLFDMGCEYFGYGSDVTCSFPANGKFADTQRIVHEGVLAAQVTVYDMIRPGTSYVDCHKRAEQEILRALVKLDVVRPGDKSLEDLVDLRLGAVFMPHGLGHFIGIDTHDVGGYGGPEPRPVRSSEPGLKSLRAARILQENMILTVEPGCYFIDHLLDDSLANDSPLSSYLNADKVNEMRGFGGVRLEDVVQVTSDGCVNYTLCPRTVDEIESTMNGGKWPPTSDAAPELRRVRLCNVTPLPAPISV